MATLLVNHREIYCSIADGAPIIDALQEALRLAKIEQSSVIVTSGNVVLWINGDENWRDLVAKFYEIKFSRTAFPAK